jgi:hypothetical protein
MNTTVDEIIQVIQRAMLKWGHHNAPDCVCCIQTSMIIDEIKREFNGAPAHVAQRPTDGDRWSDCDGYRVEDGVIIDGPKS